MKHLISFLLIMTSISFSADTLKVAVHEISPLVMKVDGTYIGFDIETIESIAVDMDIEIKYIHAETFREMFSLVDSGVADMSIGGITINQPREEKYDFPHPYKKSGMTILIRDEGDSDIIGALAIVFNGSFKQIWVAFLLLVILAAHIVWFTERGSPAFHDKYSIGIWEGLWYSVVTVTTVGYGDKVPQKAISKVVAVFVMLIGIGVAGIAMSQLSAVMNVQMIKYSINAPKDLKGKSVAVVAGTTSEYLSQTNKSILTKARTIDEAVLMLEASKVDAVVFDAPILQHFAINNEKLTTVGGIFEIQDYGILLPTNSKYREQISLSILKLKSTKQYQKILSKWFGENAE